MRRAIAAARQRRAADELVDPWSAFPPNKPPVPDDPSSAQAGLQVAGSRCARKTAPSSAWSAGALGRRTDSGAGEEFPDDEGFPVPEWLYDTPYGREKYPHKKHGRRRYAQPDYLQKADDALTQLLNQKAEEFQQTIAPLQQALVTVQQAEQLQQQANPLNVLPPPGTVNVMPGSEDRARQACPPPGHRTWVRRPRRWPVAAVVLLRVVDPRRVALPRRSSGWRCAPRVGSADAGLLARWSGKR